MTQSRRTFLATSAAAGAITLLPFCAAADGHGADVFETPAGDITIYPVSHASFVMQTPVGNIYVDPVGDPSAYADLPVADLILVTHEHGDHFNVGTLTAVSNGAPMITNPAVMAKLPAEMQSNASALANGTCLRPISDIARRNGSRST